MKNNASTKEIDNLNVFVLPACPGYPWSPPRNHASATPKTSTPKCNHMRILTHKICGLPRTHFVCIWNVKCFSMCFISLIWDLRIQRRQFLDRPPQWPGPSQCFWTTRIFWFWDQWRWNESVTKACELNAQFWSNEDQMRKSGGCQTKQPTLRGLWCDVQAWGQPQWKAKHTDCPLMQDILISIFSSTELASWNLLTRTHKPHQFMR